MSLVSVPFMSLVSVPFMSLVSVPGLGPWSRSLVLVPFMALNQAQDQVQVRGPDQIQFLSFSSTLTSPATGPGGGLSGIHPGTMGDNKGLWGKISSVYE